MSLTPRTCVSVESSSVQTLKVSAVSSSSAVVWWNSVPGATGYRLVWGPTPGERPSASAFSGALPLLRPTTVSVLRVRGTGPSKAAGPERQHRRVPAEERGPRHGVRPDPLRAVWARGGTRRLRHLQDP